MAHPPSDAPEERDQFSSHDLTNNNVDFIQEAINLPIKDWEYAENAMGWRAIRVRQCFDI